MVLEEHFFRHDVYKDKESDEIGPNARGTYSDSEASDDESGGGGACSAADPASAWMERRMPERIQHATAAQHKRSKNTGPKGVLNDYKEFKRQEQLERERNDLIRQATLLRIATGYVAPLECTDPIETQQEEIDLDDEFMNEFREMRLKEMLKRDTRPQFGELEYVEPLAFVDIVDAAASVTPVLIHLYEPFLNSCQKINTHLKSLAGKYRHVRFLTLQASKGDFTMHHKDLPIFMVYQSGQLIHTIVDVIKLMEGDITPKKSK